MDEKNVKRNMDYMKSAEAVKDSLENLCLYLNEIEKLIHEERQPEKTDGHDGYKYRLQVLEQYISDMNELFKLISKENKNENITLS